MNYAELSWYQIVAQPILWLSVISMTVLLPLDYIWFFLQWSLAAISLQQMNLRFWNDFVSLCDGYYLIAVNNSIVNVLILLPLDFLAIGW